MNADQALASIGFINLPQSLQEKFKDLPLDPAIKLPVEFCGAKEHWKVEDITWQAIISGMVRVLIYQPQHENADYFRKLILIVKPDIKQEFTQAGINKAKDKDFAVAVEIFQAVEAIFPDCVLSSLNLALVYEEQAHYYTENNNETEAEKYNNLAFTAYKKALNKDSDMPQVHFNLGFFYLKQKNFLKTKEHFKIFLQKSKIESEKERVKKILNDIETALKTDSLFKKAYDNIMMGKEEEGIKNIKKFIKVYPDSWNAWFMLGWGYRRLEQYKQAKEAFYKALKLGPPQADILNELAIAMMRLGEFDECIDRLNQALHLEAKNPKVISNLGVVNLKMGNLAQARTYFKQVLRITPNDEVALSYLEIIAKQEKDN